MIEQKEITIRGITIHCQMVGIGPSGIVFIHGNSMDSGTWLPQLMDERLNKKYRLIAIDLPGHGNSSRMNGDFLAYSPKTMGQLIHEVINHLDLDEFILVGVSFGTNIIGEVSPVKGRCRGIALAGPCIVNDKFPPSKIILPVLNGHVTVSENASSEEVYNFIKPVVNHNIQVAERFVASYQKTDGNFRNAVLKSILEGDFADELENIKRWEVPVCVVVGENEILVDKNYLIDYHPLWNNKIDWVKSAGHLPNEEQPENFNKLLAEFSEAAFR